MQVTMQTGALPITPGRSYLAALRAVSSDEKWGNVGDIYPEGGYYHFKTTGSILGVSNIDLAFTAEFVGGEDQIYGPVPEPATLAMLGLALLAVRGCARRRNPRGVTRSPRTSRTYALSFMGCIASAFFWSGLIFSMAPPPAHAQTLEWVRQFGTEKQEGGNGVSADGLGNVYVAGVQTGYFTPDPNDFPLSKAFVNKYDAAGSLQWTRTSTADSPDGAYGVSADGLGHVYISGNSGGVGPLIGSSDVFVSKYDASGNLQWRSTSHLNAGTGSADGMGSVYITGWTYDPNDVQHPFVSKYTADGNFEWIRQFGSEKRDYANAVSADGLGNVYVVGATNGNLAGPNAGGSDAFLSKFDAAGNHLWSRQFGASSNQNFSYVSADRLGNVFVSGSSDVSLGQPAQFYIRKFDAAGDLQWTTPLGDITDFLTGVSADGLGNAYLTGDLLNDAGIPFGRPDLDVFVTKYDVHGAPVWTRQLGSNDYEHGGGVSADGLGNVYVTGRTYGDLQAPNAGDEDAFVAKFFDCGGCEPPLISPVVADTELSGEILRGSLVTQQFTTLFGDLPVSWINLESTRPTVNPPTLTESGLFSWQTSELDIGGPYQFDVTATNIAGRDTGRLTLRLAFTPIIPEPSAVLLVSLGIGTSMMVLRARR
jgi:hypothetical protein